MKKIGTLKTRYTSTLESLGEEPFPDSILSAPVIGFGYGKRKLHKTLMDVLRGNEARLLKQRAEASNVPKRWHAMTPEPKHYCVEGIALSLIGSSDHFTAPASHIGRVYYGASPQVGSS